MGAVFNGRWQHDRVIVAVEGPSAAGKTTWCRSNAVRFVSEYQPTGAEPDTTNFAAQADYWAAVNSDRWGRAIEMEEADRIAVCDSDPLKLHYSWCLARVGAQPWERFRFELDRTRHAFARHELGLPDLVLISNPDAEELRSRRDHDHSRTRRSFELHARLAEPLTEWYSAMDQLEPDRVIWGLPTVGELPVLSTRTHRYSVVMLDDLVSQLPSV